MRLLDEEFTQHHFKGVRGLRDHLRLAGHVVNEKHVRRLVRLMGHEPVYPKPRLTIPGQGVTPYPYLLRERPATAPNEVWSTDITYVPMAKGFLHHQLQAYFTYYNDRRPQQSLGAKPQPKSSRNLHLSKHSTII